MTPSLPLCVAVLGQPDEGWVGTLLAQLPPDVELIVLDTEARIVDCLDRGQATLRVRANAVLPPHAIRRLREAAAAAPELDAISAADVAVAALNPLPEGRSFSGDAIELDAACWMLGRRQIRPCGDASGALTLFAPSAAERLADGRPLRCGVIDSLHVTARDSVLRGPPSPEHRHLAAPDTALAELRAALAEAGPLPNLRPGLDRRSVVLHVLHGWGGGIERFALDLADGDDARWHLALIARGEWTRQSYGEVLEAGLIHDNRIWPIARYPIGSAIRTCAIDHPEWRAIFGDLKRRFGIGSILISSLIGHSLDALATGLPTEWVCHDYFPLWPILHADFDQLDPSPSALAEALASAKAPEFPFAERDAGYWRALRNACVARLVAHDVRLCAPSNGVRSNWLRLAPELEAQTFAVIGHGLRDFGARPLPPPPRRARLRLCVLGRIHGGKGETLLQALLRTDVREHAELFLIGCGRSGNRFLGESSVHLIPEYRREELPDLLARIAPDAALLPSTVAESFSYTLSESRALGLPVIATRLGAFTERINDGRDGLLVAPDARAIAALIAELHDDPGPLAAIREHLARNRPDLGLSAMATAHRTLVAGVGQSPKWLFAADPGPAMLAARALDAERMRDALSARETEQRAELERRSEWARKLGQAREAAEALAEQRLQQCRRYETEIEHLHGSLARLQREFDERSAWALRLDDEVRRLGAELQAEAQRHQQAHTEWSAAAEHFRREIERLEAEKRQLLGSLSWRLTKPLRFARRQFGSARIRLRYLARRGLGLPPRVLRSLRTRGLKGTIERIRGGEGSRPIELPQPVAPAASDPPVTKLIVLPRAAQPRASIVIPVFNKWRYTEACLRSLAREVQRTGFEVIVVDDCSSDETWERLQRIEGIIAHRNEANLGFVGSCNAGAALATGDFLVFLNNDTQVTPNWLDALLDTFETHTRVGLVGAKLVYPDGRLQEAGGIVFSDGSGWNYGRFGDPNDPAYNYVREVDYCSGAAIAIPRALFERVGGFDPRYAPAYYEDTDLAFRVREAGLRVLYQPAATVFHYEGVTAGTDIASGIKKHQALNQRTFLERWAEVLPKQPAPGTPIEFAREHRVKQRILIVDATTPHPDEDSGSVRMVNLIRVMIALGHKVCFFAENRAFDGRYTEALQQLGVEVLYHPWMPEPTRWLREHGARFDTVVLSRHYVAAPLVEAVRHYAPKARLVFDTVDLHYLREEREAKLTNRDDLRRQAAATKLAELRLIRQCDVTLVVSPIEQELLHREVPGARVEVLSNVHEVVGRRAGFEARKDLFFVGGFQHQPNVDAMLWFVHAIWPRIAAELQDARFHIVGSKMPDAIKALASDRVIVHGFLPSLDPMLDGCRLAVAPLRYGAGVKGKINQSMAHGQPVVATTIAAEGMYLQHEIDVLIADDAPSFAREVIRLYRDQDLWTRLSDAALTNIANHFSFAAATQAMQRVLG